jgi:hypothetical protein
MEYRDSAPSAVTMTGDRDPSLTSDASLPGGRPHANSQTSSTSISYFTNSLFEEPWWLDAVAPGTWRALEIRRGSEIAGRLVVEVRSQFAVRVVRNPPLTQSVGPWLQSFDGKQTTRLRHENELMAELIRMLPPSDVLELTLAPQFTNPHPFHWASFEQTVACTYQLTDVPDRDAFWAQLSDGARRQVRKAQKLVVVRDELSADDLYDVAMQTWLRQNRRPPYDRALLSRICKAAAERDGLLVLGAYGADGQAHAAICVVYDSRSAHYIVGGGSGELRASGAHSLLMWEAINRLAGRAKVFDFMGSMSASIEHFFRGFGPRRALLLQPRRYSLRGRVARGVRQWFLG